MTIVTDFDIGERVMLQNGETGAITSIRIMIREGKPNPEYKVEYEVDHNFIRYSYQLRLL